jgi:protein LSM14
VPQLTNRRSSLISLISKSDVRYQGVLHEINSENSTVSLSNVQSFGTEGRRNGVDEMEASEDIWQYIVFRGSDVKDLQIVEPPKAKTQNPPPSMPNDPAILGVSHHCGASGVHKQMMKHIGCKNITCPRAQNRVDISVAFLLIYCSIIEFTASLCVELC